MRPRAGSLHDTGAPRHAKSRGEFEAARDFRTFPSSFSPPRGRIPQRRATLAASTGEHKRRSTEANHEDRTLCPICRETVHTRAVGIRRVDGKAGPLPHTRYRKTAARRIRCRACRRAFPQGRRHFRLGRGRCRVLRRRTGRKRGGRRRKANQVRRRAGHPAPYPAHGVHELERLRQQGHAGADGKDGGRPGGERACRLRIRLREHRFRLAARIRRTVRRDPAEREVPGHEGVLRENARQGAEMRHLLHADAQGMGLSGRVRVHPRMLPGGAGSALLLHRADRERKARAEQCPAVGRMGIRLSQVRLDPVRSDACRKNEKGASRRHPRLRPVCHRQRRRVLLEVLEGKLRLVALQFRFARRMGQDQGVPRRHRPMEAGGVPRPLFRPRHDASPTRCAPSSSRPCS